MATLTYDTVRSERISRNLCILPGKIAFDSSYPYGGESMSALANYFKGTVSSELVVLFEQAEGLTFQWDRTNTKVQVFAPAPPIIYDEVQTIASNAVTLKYPAVAILYGASASATQLMIEASDTLASNEMNLNAAMAWGTRPTIDFDSSTSGAITIGYITQAVRELWLKRDAAIVVATATHVADLGLTVMFMESCLATGSTGSSRPIWLRGGDAAATTESEIDFTDSGASSAGDTTLTFAAGDAITTTTSTYIELPASGFWYDHFIEDEDLTMSSGTGASAYPILINSLCGQIPDYTAANERDAHHLMMAAGDALGTGQECAIDWHLRKTLAGTQIRTNDTTSDALSLTYVKGGPTGIPNLVPLEVPNGDDLSHATARFIAIGLK